MRLALSPVAPSRLWCTASVSFCSSGSQLRPRRTLSRVVASCSQSVDGFGLCSVIPVLVCHEDVVGKLAGDARHLCLTLVRRSAEQAEWLATAKREWTELLQCPCAWSDREVVLAVVHQGGCELEHAVDELCADRELVLVAVQQNGLALEFALDSLREDWDVALASEPVAGVKRPKLGHFKIRGAWRTERERFETENTGTHKNLSLQMPPFSNVVQEGTPSSTKGGMDHRRDHGPNNSRHDQHSSSMVEQGRHTQRSSQQGTQKKLPHTMTLRSPQESHPSDEHQKQESTYANQQTWAP